VGEPFRFDAWIDVSNACFESGDAFDEVHDVAHTPLEGSCDVFMHRESPSLDYDICTSNPLDHSHASLMCSLPFPSPEYDIDMPIENPMIFDANVDLGYKDKMFNVLGGNVDYYLSLGYLRGYDPSIDSYCVCLENLPRKITRTTFFNHRYDFSVGFDKVKRILILFGVILVVASYLYFLNCAPRSLISSCVL